MLQTMQAQHKGESEQINKGKSKASGYTKESAAPIAPIKGRPTREGTCLKLPIKV